MLIMGFGPRKPKNQGDVAPALCPNCGNHVMFQLLELRNWFSVFFVPIVPGRARHAVVCPVCQYGIGLEPDQRRLAAALVELTARQRDGGVDPAEYRRTVDSFWSALGGERLADAGDARPSGPPTDRPPLDAPPPTQETTQPSPPPGWYADPFGEAEQRYWDGERWTAGTNPPLFKKENGSEAENGPDTTGGP